MGLAIVIGCTKRQFQTANLLKVNSKPIFLKINIFQVVIFQNVLMDIKILNEKQIFLFFSISFGIFMSFQFVFGIFVSFQFHTNVNMCYFIWICWDYFKKLTFFFFEMKLLSNKKFSLEYLIQGFNPICWFNVYPP